MNTFSLQRTKLISHNFVRMINKYKLELTDDELQVLVDTGDMDKDGKIGIEDFRSLSNITFKKSDEK